MSNDHTTGRRLLQSLLAALWETPGAGLPDEALSPDRIRLDGQGALPSRYPVTSLACASIGAAALALARWIDPDHPPRVELDRALASWWFGYTLRPEGWAIPKVRDAVTGDYATMDGWIRLHANAAHHRQRALQVLGLPPDAGHEAVAAQVLGWTAEALEDALVDQAACAAALRTPAQWRRHPQGQAVAAEPLLHRRDGLACRGIPVQRAAGCAIDPTRPLAGLRVLDLTRVLAGPAATRFLAAYGAQVLRLDPADWQEPGMVPEVTVGKRCAALDLRDPAGRMRFEQLLAQADVLVHGYRPGALEGLGYGDDVRQQIRPGLVDVCLDAWGWSGPWCGRRGFDSLVQMSTGIAWPGGPDRPPDPLPVQALDQAAGYWMAACVLQGLIQRRAQQRGSLWRVSLARMADLLAAAQSAAPGGMPGMDGAAGCDATGAHEKAVLALGPAPLGSYDPTLEATAWGPARRLLAPCLVGEARWQWDRPAGPLRRDPPAWW